MPARMSAGNRLDRMAPRWGTGARSRSVHPWMTTPGCWSDAPAPVAGTAELVWSVMAAAIGAHGIPQRSLTDNGTVYPVARRGG